MAKSLVLNLLGKAADVVVRAATLGNDPKILATRVLPTLGAAIHSGITNNILGRALNLPQSKGVQSNTGVPVLDRVVSAAANQPFVTALGGAIAAAPKAALTLVTPVVKAVGNSIANLSLKSKIVLGVGATVGIPAVLTSKKLQTASSKILDNPIGELNQLGTDIGRLIDDPSIDNTRNLVANSPLLAPTAALLTLGGGALTALPAINSLVTNANIRSLKDSPSSTTYTREPEGLMKTDSSNPSISPLLSPQANTSPLTTVYPDKGISKGSIKRHKKRVLAPTYQNIFKPQLIVMNRNG